MGKEFCVGLMLGAIGGMLIVANSNKARKAVQEKQEELMNKVNGLTDNAAKSDKNKNKN